MAGTIYEAINAVMLDCPAIAKGQKNQQQGFMYRGVDVVMNVLQPLMSKHGIFIVPEVLDSKREERATKSGSVLNYTILRIKFTFYAKDGSNVAAIVQGEGMDSADKSSNKAMSVAFKYACSQVFCIPTEEMKDPDADTHDLAPEHKCAICGAEVSPIGAKKSMEHLGTILCAKCATKAKAEREAI